MTLETMTLVDTVRRSTPYDFYANQRFAVVGSRRDVGNQGLFIGLLCYSGRNCPVVGSAVWLR